MVSSVNPDHPVGSMNMKGQRNRGTLLCKIQDVLDGLFELLVFCFYFDVIYPVCELLEHCIGRWSFLEEEAPKL